MKEIEMVDARGRACPEPVIMAKKALAGHDTVVVLVDTETAVENVKRLGANSGCAVRVEEMEGGAYRIHLQQESDSAAAPVAEFAPSCAAAVGPFVVVFAENRMGRGSDELGTVLVRAFLHTLCEQETKPDAIIFYNSGVKLTVRDSDVVDDLRRLDGEGVELLVCGTCVNYFEIGSEVAVGTISNMYDIAGLMSRAGRLLVP
jgi:selenium metabolism protein YedF